MKTTNNFDFFTLAQLDFGKVYLVECTFDLNPSRGKRELEDLGVKTYIYKAAVDLRIEPNDLLLDGNKSHFSIVRAIAVHGNEASLLAPGITYRPVLYNLSHGTPITAHYLMKDAGEEHLMRERAEKFERLDHYRKDQDYASAAKALSAIMPASGYAIAANASGAHTPPDEDFDDYALRADAADTDAAEEID